METPDIELQHIEVLWSRFKQRLISTPAARYSDFALEYPDDAEEILRVFPLMQQLDLLLEVQADDELVPLPVSIGRYPIVRRIGVGGMGVVYEAQCDALRERIAIKVISSDRLEPKDIKRFEQEARAVASLHHTNIVPIYEFGQEDGKHFYTMRLVDGPNLAEVTRLAELTERDEFSESEETDVRAYQLLARLAGNWPLIAELGYQAALALEHAHSKEILHRDIKPANLLVDGADKLWISDFGLAKKIMAENELTSVFQTVGTPRYMAPEQAKGLADPRSDLYSLGVTLYELVTLQPGESPYRVSGVEMAPTPRSINPRVPAELDAIVVKAIQPNPAKRHQSATELANELKQCVEELKRGSRKPRVPAAVAAFASVLLVALSLPWMLGLFSTRNQPRLSIESFVVAEGTLYAGEIPQEVGQLERWRMTGVDGSRFKIEPNTRKLMFSQAANFEVPLDHNMDNLYEIQLESRQEHSKQQYHFDIRVTDVNEPPEVDEFCFASDGVTVHRSGEDLDGAWLIPVRDDHDSTYAGLCYAISGGVDRNFIQLTPHGTCTFDPRMKQANPSADADGNGVFEIEVSICDQTEVWLARLEQRADGKIALLKERPVGGNKTESLELADDCLIRRDVIDFASHDGIQFYHIHPGENGRIQLFKSALDQNGQFLPQLLSEDCGLPAETIGLATVDGESFQCLCRKRGETQTTTLIDAVLNADGNFSIEIASRDCGLAPSVEGIAGLDAARFYYMYRDAAGVSSYDIAFFDGQHFSSLPSGGFGFNPAKRNRGLAAWSKSSPTSLTTVQVIRFNTNRE